MFSEQFKHTLDGSLATISIASFMQIVPPVAALLTLVYFLFRVLNEYEVWKQNKGKSRDLRRRSTDKVKDQQDG